MLAVRTSHGNRLSQLKLIERQVLICLICVFDCFFASLQSTVEGQVLGSIWLFVIDLLSDLKYFTLSRLLKGLFILLNCDFRITLIDQDFWIDQFSFYWSGVFGILSSSGLNRSLVLSSTLLWISYIKRTWRSSWFFIVF